MPSICSPLCLERDGNGSRIRNGAYRRVVSTFEQLLTLGVISRSQRGGDLCDFVSELVCVTLSKAVAKRQFLAEADEHEQKIESVHKDDLADGSKWSI